MSYDQALKLNSIEIDKIIDQLKLGKMFSYTGEPDLDPYGAGSHHKTTISYNITNDNYSLLYEFWASQYNTDPEVTTHILSEEKLRFNLLAVYRTRFMEV